MIRRKNTHPESPLFRLSIPVRLIFTAWILSILPVKAQQPAVYNSDMNILRFADYLLRDSDFLRASIEYKRLENSPLWGDSLILRTGVALMNADKYEEAGYLFRSVSSREYEPHADYYYRYGNLLSPGSMPPPRGLSEYALSDQPVFLRLKYLTFAVMNINHDAPVKAEVFSEQNRKNFLRITAHNASPDYRSPLAAALFSTVLPGSGKIYTGFYGDGVVSLLMTGLMTYLSWDNFKSENNIRRWIFGGLAAFFYAGNIYGSYISAEVYNHNKDEEIQRLIDEMLFSDEIRNPEGLEVIK